MGDTASAVDLIRAQPRENQIYVLYHLPMEFGERIMALMKERVHGDDVEQARDLGALQGYANILSGDLERPYSPSFIGVYKRCHAITDAMEASLAQYPALPIDLRCRLQIMREILSDYINEPSLPDD